MIKVLIVSPANYATGGVELLHQLCFELNKAEDVDARIWYRGAGTLCPQPKEYISYGCRWVKDLPEGYNGVLVFPEIWANDVADEQFSRCRKVIFWESVDNYFSHTAPADYYRFVDHQLMKKDRIIHLAQSWYACDFIERISKPYILIGDYINDDFFADRPEMERGSAVLYNPKKGMSFTRKLIESARNTIEFVPIENMDRSRVIALMRRSRLYIDFGNHPGRERLPREAAVCGCCVITGRDGSAGNDRDIPIPDNYKFDCSEKELPFIHDRIRYVLWNYQRCKKDFDHYRSVIGRDKKTFEEQCRFFISILRAEERRKGNEV